MLHIKKMFKTTVNGHIYFIKMKNRTKDITKCSMSKSLVMLTYSVPLYIFQAPGEKKKKKKKNNNNYFDMRYKLIMIAK